ncbi:MAG: cytosine permease [Rhodoglobus sp.]
MANDDEAPNAGSRWSMFSASGDDHNPAARGLVPTSAISSDSEDPATADDSPHDVHDDDALADALENEFSRMSTGTIPAAVASQNDGAALDETAFELPVSEQDPLSPVSFSEQSDEVAATPNIDSAPWASFPAPDPSQAVHLPEGPPVSESDVSNSAAESIAQESPAISASEPGSSPEAQDIVDGQEAEPLASAPHPAPPSGRPVPNAWTAWAPLPKPPAESDAMPSPEAGSAAPEQEEHKEDPESPFPWIVAAEAAAASSVPLVPPVDSDPFHWSISPTGKVAYSEALTDDEGTTDAAVGSQEHPTAELSDPTPTPTTPSSREATMLDPLLMAAGDPVPTETGSITVINRSYEKELEDDVDETDRVSPDSRHTGTSNIVGWATSTATNSPPARPISTARMADDEPVFFNDEPQDQNAFSREGSGIEPTPADLRAGQAARLFWLWFSANSSILSVGLGAILVTIGMSLTQSLFSVFVGLALSFIPLGVTTLAGRRSGQPTMIVSRAIFGVVGNVVPAALALLSRVFWAAALLWLFSSSIAASISGGTATVAQAMPVSLIAGFALAVLCAFLGYPVLARLRLIVSITSAALIVGLIAATSPFIDLEQAFTASEGSWLLALTGAVLVFSFVGLVWAQSGSDLARYQRPDSPAATSMLWASCGAAVPSFVLIGYGALLAASNPEIAANFATEPLLALSSVLPDWYPVPLVALAAASLLFGVTIAIYSGGFALQSIGVRLSRHWSTLIISAMVALVAAVMALGITTGATELFRDLATTVAVPTAGWIGIFAAETLMRNQRFDAPSLLTRGGEYPDVRWTNLIGLVGISLIGFGFTSATPQWLSWQGYLFGAIGVPLDSSLAGTDLGVLLALLLGGMVPLVTAMIEFRRHKTVSM